MQQHAPSWGIAQYAYMFCCKLGNLGIVGFYCLGMQGTSLFLQYLKCVLLPIVGVGTATRGYGVFDGWISSLPSQIIQRTVACGRGNTVKQVVVGPVVDMIPCLWRNFLTAYKKVDRF
jgi:hypothetical protein